MSRRIFIIVIAFIAINNFALYYFFINDKNTNKNDAEYICSLRFSSVSFLNLKKDILSDGNISNYNELKKRLSSESIWDYTLVWSLIMANKYDYAQAYYDVFLCLATIKNYKEEGFFISNIYMEENGVSYFLLDHLDETTRVFALDFLNKASEKGVREAKRELGSYYSLGKYLPKDTVLGKKLIEESK